MESVEIEERVYLFQVELVGMLLVLVSILLIVDKVDELLLELDVAVEYDGEISDRVDLVESFFENISGPVEEALPYIVLCETDPEIAHLVCILSDALPHDVGAVDTLDVRWVGAHQFAHLDQNVIFALALATHELVVIVNLLHQFHTLVVVFHLYQILYQ